MGRKGARGRCFAVADKSRARAPLKGRHPLVASEGAAGVFDLALHAGPKKLTGAAEMTSGPVHLVVSRILFIARPRPAGHEPLNLRSLNMNADQILSEIREANLSYLMLAQSLIRSDREQALYRLGISEESASLIALLSPAQMMKIAAGNTLLCRFRMDADDMVRGLLLNHGKSAANDSTSRLHASILLAGRHQEAA
jgi:flagellar transcriptional activator FlhD